MIFDVKCPIPGFEKTTKMRFEKTDKDEFFARLHSEDGDPFSFTLINPYALIKDYAFELPNHYRALLEVTEKSNIKVYNILILKENVESSYINLLSPILLNFDNFTMTQVVLDPALYPFYPQAEPLRTYLNSLHKEQSGENNESCENDEASK